MIDGKKDKEERPTAEEQQRKNHKAGKPPLVFAPPSKAARSYIE
jgi:hypothetical protein